MTNKLFFLYWLPGQSKLFSEPYYYGTNDPAAFEKALQTAQENGCEIEFMYKRTRKGDYDNIEFTRE